MAPTTTSGAAAQAAALAQARLPPLQQGPGFQGGPSAGAVPADWARAYREQQHKAAQVSLLGVSLDPSFACGSACYFALLCGIVKAAM